MRRHSAPWTKVRGQSPRTKHRPPNTQHRPSPLPLVPPPTYLDLDVPEGTCVGLLGPNGAGKTTTMKMLTAQAIADEGEIEVLGHVLPDGHRLAVRHDRHRVGQPLGNPDLFC